MTVTPQLNAIFVGLGSTPLIPGGKAYVEITPASANVAFQAAIDALPANGGILYVMPGDADYEFQAAVLVNKPNVTIDFVGGSTLTFSSIAHPKPRDLFLVVARGFRSSGARVVFAIDGQDNEPNRSCFRIEADDADVSNCTFRILQGDVGIGGVITYFCCMRLVGADPFLRSIRVARNIFELDEQGVDQVEPWNTQGPFPVPRGVCCIGADRVRGLVVAENQVRSTSAVGVKAACGPALFLSAVEHCAVTANSFRELRTSPGGQDEDRGAIVRIIGGTSEGHHTVFSANVLTDLESAFVVALDLARYDGFAANVFDNIGTTDRPCWSVIRAMGSEVLGVAANAITRITGNASTSEAAVYLEDLTNATLSGNLFSDVKTGAGAFGIKAGTCSNIQIDPQQARTDSP